MFVCVHVCIELSDTHISAVCTFLHSHWLLLSPHLTSTLSLVPQVMDRFNVDIRFPKDKGSGVVVIQGLEENVEDAKEHLITLAEDYVSWVEISCDAHVDVM